MEGPQTHGPAEVSAHEFDSLCEADLHTVSSWRPVAAAVEDVGCTGDVSPPPSYILQWRLATSRRRATESVVDLAQYRNALVC